MSRHIVLAGDSIFDNDAYVMGERGVIEQMRAALPRDWSAFKVAVDGDCIRDVGKQVAELPTHATDLIVSVGGNDALQHSHLLDRARSIEDLQTAMIGPLAAFAAEYGDMLDALAALPVRLHVCTIYTAIPFEESLWRAHAPIAIGAFNAVIMGEAARRGIEVLRLDFVCTEARDFSAVSPIEPSAKGGEKIVALILDTLQRA